MSQPKIQRLPDWAGRLLQFFKSVEQRRFEWGQHDCCLFAAGAVKAMTGHDFGHGFRGKYNTEAQAGELLLSFGGVSSLGDLWLGQRADAQFLSRGDVAAIRTPNGIGLGVVDLSGQRIAAAGAAGLCRLDWPALHGWGIG